MENKKTSEFDKVFSAWDILVIAFGAMIGWDLCGADCSDATVRRLARVQPQGYGTGGILYMYLGDRAGICQCCVL